MKEYTHTPKRFGTPEKSLTGGRNIIPLDKRSPAKVIIIINAVQRITVVSICRYLVLVTSFANTNKPKKKQGICHIRTYVSVKVVEGLGIQSNEVAH